MVTILFTHSIHQSIYIIDYKRRIMGHLSVFMVLFPSGMCFAFVTHGVCSVSSFWSKSVMSSFDSILWIMNLIPSQSINHQDVYTCSFSCVESYTADRFSTYLHYSSVFCMKHNAVINLNQCLNFVLEQQKKWKRCYLLARKSGIICIFHSYWALYGFDCIVLLLINLHSVCFSL